MRSFYDDLFDLCTKLEPDSIDELNSVLDAPSNAALGSFRKLTIPDFIASTTIAPVIAAFVSHYLASNKEINLAKIIEQVDEIRSRNGLDHQIVSQYTTLLEETFNTIQDKRNASLVRQFSGIMPLDLWAVRTLYFVAFWFFCLFFSFAYSIFTDGPSLSPEEMVLWMKYYHISSTQIMTLLIGDLTNVAVGAGTVMTITLTLIIIGLRILLRRARLAFLVDHPSNGTLLQVSLLLSQLGVHSGFIIKTSKSGEYFTASRIFGKPV